jgi:hypothetical protein
LPVDSSVLVRVVVHPQSDAYYPHLALPRSNFVRFVSVIESASKVSAGQRPDSSSGTTDTQARQAVFPVCARYDGRVIRARWLPVWDQFDQFRGTLTPGRERRYVLGTFPYPSGDLHMARRGVRDRDVVARHHFQHGDDVLHPIGWDSFGLAAENAAIKRDAHPAKQWYFKITDYAQRLLDDMGQLRSSGPSACC